MAVVSLPTITSQLLAAAGIIGPNPWRTLICGQIGANGTAVTQVAYQEIQNLSTAQIISLFGSNSEMTNRILRHLSIMNGVVSVWAIGLSPAAYAIPATFSMVISGTATSAGTINLQLVDANNYSVQVQVNIGDTATVIATNIQAAIVALGTLQPFTIALVSSTINFTASDGGSLGNKYTIGYSGILPTGINITTGQFTGGATDPTNTAIFTNVSTTRFHSISWPWQTNYTTLNSFLAARNVINNAVLQGVGFIGYDDTEPNIHTALNGTVPVNSQNLVFMGNKLVAGVSQIITPPDWRVAEFLAIEALRMTSGAPISKYVVSTAPNDQYGGPSLASLPYFNTPLAMTNVSNAYNQFTQTEQNAAVVDGYTVIGVNQNNSQAIMGQVITTYKTNSQGQVDTSFKYLEYVRTGYLALELIFLTQKSDFAQTRLTSGDLVAGFSMANQASITAEMLGLYRSLANLVLLQAGKAAEQKFLNNLVVTLNMATGTVTESGILTIVTQLRTINQTFQLAFTI